MIQFFEKNYKLSFFITCMIAIMISTLSSISIKAGAIVSGVGTKSYIYHFLAFFFLCAFIMLTLIQGKNREYLLASFLLAVIYAVFDEIHQLFVVGRFFSLGDILIDSFGVLFAVIMYMVLLEARA